MNIAKKLFDFLSGDGGLVGKVLDKVKLDKSEKAALEFEMRKLAMEESLRAEGEFRTWVLDYEGRAADIPRGVLTLRSTVRPVLTYALAIAFIGSHVVLFWKNGGATPAMEQAQSMLFKMNLLSLGFWYGEKLLSRTGLVDVLKRP